MAKVSVVIPVYNGEGTIARALASVFAQSYRDYEVIVIDDGSTDRTLAIVAGYADRIRLISQRKLGVSVARNSGVRAAGGDYLAFLDDDDEWMPEKLARCVPVLEADPECTLVYTLALRVDRQGHPMGTQEDFPGELESPSMKQMLESPWTVVPSQFVVRRSVFERCGGFCERLVSCEDSYFLLGAREYGYFRCVPETLLRKETRPLFPKALEREPACDLFVRLVRERYGHSADGLIHGFRRSRVKVMRHLARILVNEGRTEEARRCLARILYYEPTSPKAYYRYLKTFLAPRVARDSSSSTAD